MWRRLRGLVLPLRSWLLGTHLVVLVMPVVVLLATDGPARLYEFSGGTDAHSLFQAAAASGHVPFLQPGTNEFVNTRMSVCVPRRVDDSLGAIMPPEGEVLQLGTDKHPLPQCLVMTTSEGLLVVQLDLAGIEEGARQCLRRHHLLPLPTASSKVGDFLGPGATTSQAGAARGPGSERGSGRGAPSAAGAGASAQAPLRLVDVVVSDYHILYLFTTRLVAVNRVSYEVVWLCSLEGSGGVAAAAQAPLLEGRLLPCGGAFISDPAQADGKGPPSLLLATDRSMGHLQLNNEGSQLWHIFLRQAQEQKDDLLFTRARKLCPVRTTPAAPSLCRLTHAHVATPPPLRRKNTQRRWSWHLATFSWNKAK